MSPSRAAAEAADASEKPPSHNKRSLELSASGPPPSLDPSLAAALPSVAEYLRHIAVHEQAYVQHVNSEAPSHPTNSSQQLSSSTPPSSSEGMPLQGAPLPPSAPTPSNLPVASAVPLPTLVGIGNEGNGMAGGKSHKLGALPSADSDVLSVPVSPTGSLPGGYGDNIPADLLNALKAAGGLMTPNAAAQSPAYLSLVYSALAKHYAQLAARQQAGGAPPNAPHSGASLSSSALHSSTCVQGQLPMPPTSGPFGLTPFPQLPRYERPFHPSLLPAVPPRLDATPHATPRVAPPGHPGHPGHPTPTNNAPPACPQGVVPTNDRGFLPPPNRPSSMYSLSAFGKSMSATSCPPGDSAPAAYPNFSAPLEFRAGALGWTEVQLGAFCEHDAKRARLMTSSNEASAAAARNHATDHVTADSSLDRNHCPPHVSDEDVLSCFADGLPAEGLPFFPTI